MKPGKKKEKKSERGVASAKSHRRSPRKLKLLNRSDRALLKDLGFRKNQSLTKGKKLASELNMRQLDRLKMMLRRVERRSSEIIPEKARSGIDSNDTDAFALAVQSIMRTKEKKRRGRG